MAEFRLKFGPTLRAMREAHGYKQKDVADALDVSITYVSQVEAGTRPAWAADVVAGLARQLGFSALEAHRLEVARLADEGEVSLKVGDGAPSAEACAALSLCWAKTTDDDVSKLVGSVMGRK
jgi:transcriptional regulator with XRE-family HTH domain